MAAAASLSFPLPMMSGGEIEPPADQKPTQFTASNSIRMSDAKYHEPGIQDYGKETKAGSSPLTSSTSYFTTLNERSKGREIGYLSSQENLAICSNNSYKAELCTPQPANSSAKEAPLVIPKSKQSPTLKGEWYISKKYPPVTIPDHKTAKLVLSAQFQF